MSGQEIVVVLLGIFFGYLLVSKFIGAGKPKPNGQEAAEINRQREDKKSEQHQRHTDEPSKSKTEQALAWHEVLLVPAHASMDDIRRSYKKLMSQYHPDKVASMAPELKHICEVKTKEINVAYDEAVKLRETAG